MLACVTNVNLAFLSKCVKPQWGMQSQDTSTPPPPATLCRLAKQLGSERRQKVLCKWGSEERMR